MLKPQFTLAGPIEKILSSEHVPSWKPANNDERWMAEALKTAMTAVGAASPNPAVGCVIVSQGGDLVARGATQPFGGPHAEATAIQNAMEPHQLRGSTAYVTLEPCNHTGHQPPCTKAIIDAGIAKVIYGVKDGNPAVAGGGEVALRQGGVSVDQSSLFAECTAWHRPFLTMSETELPYIALKWAQSIDGHLADDCNLSQWISGEIARTYAHWLRSYYDDILIGAGTALIDEPQLTNRLAPIRPHQPTKIIYDPKNNLEVCKPNERLEQTLNKSIVITGQSHTSSLWYSNSVQEVVSLEGKGFEGLLSYLANRGKRSILVEGGPTTLNQFLKTQHYDSIHAIIAPLFVGGRSGKIAHGMNPTGLLAEAQKCETIQCLTLGQDVLIELVKLGRNG